MPDHSDLDLPAYYAAHFRPGAIDLSASSPRPAAVGPLVAGDAAAIDLAHTTPAASRALRAAIAARYESLAADDIIVCAGASEALSAVAFATLTAGATAWAEAATYPSFLSAARHCGAVLRTFGTPGKAILAVTNNPGVPFGDVRDTAVFIAAALAAGTTPVVDEVYRDLTLDGRRIRAAADLHPCAVSIGDLSKPLGLGGLRIGWVATRDRDLLRKVDRELQLLSGGPSTLSVAAAAVALGTFDASVEATLRLARENSEIVYEALARRGWKAHRPEAGLTAFATRPEPVTSEALSRLQAAGYFLLPTSVLGFPGGFRVSLLADPAGLERALDLISGCPRETPTSNKLVILTKAPGAGRAKTRLAAALGDNATGHLAYAFIADTLALSADRHWDTTVALEPFDAEEALRPLAPSATFAPQAVGDLGTRICHALEAATASGPAVLIGSDTPDLPKSVLAQAFEALETHDAVIGPAADGGFYLLGLRAPFPGIFADVEWSTSTVFAQTTGNIAAAGRSCALLEEWQDVDDICSLSALSERLLGSCSAPATRAVLKAFALEASHAR
jgi:hypothetical protein